jgi:nucleotide-binding universal stress UspA family protein
MNLARILLPIDSGPDFAPVAETAFALAARFGAEVEGFYARVPAREQLIFQDEAGAPMQLQALIAEAEKKAEDAKKEAEADFQKLSKAHADVTARFLAREGNISALVAQRARTADLSVVATIGTNDASAPGFGIDIRDGAIFQSGRPVIVAPSADVSANIGDEVVIAWKDGVEASRAVAAAIPFIAKASKVRILAAGKRAEEKESLNALKDYLSHYAKTVEAVTLGADKRNIGEMLAEEAGKNKDALLVMGAYSQWRWKEWAFGGVTEYMLHSTTIPVLMAH